MNNHQLPHSSGLQLRLLGLAEIDAYRFVDPLEGWDLVDVRALAIDPDVDVRRLVALSNWNWDVRLQRVLANDPDELVVLNLLSRIDPPLDVLGMILAGPHRDARRVLAARNLPTAVLLGLVDDDDDQVRRSAVMTLGRRGVPSSTEVTAR